MPHREILHSGTDGTVVAGPEGSRRSRTDARYDLISPVGLRRLAERYELGARSYGDRNWESGQYASVVMNHVLQHLIRYLDGDATDDHLAAAAWGLMALMHFEERKPEMIDIPSREEHV